MKKKLIYLKESSPLSAKKKKIPKRNEGRNAFINNCLFISKKKRLKIKAKKKQEKCKNCFINDETKIPLNFIRAILNKKNKLKNI